jgi:hypothetical protein
MMPRVSGNPSRGRAGRLENRIAATLGLRPAKPEPEAVRKDTPLPHQARSDHVTAEVNAPFPEAG